MTFSYIRRRHRFCTWYLFYSTS